MERSRTSARFPSAVRASLQPGVVLVENFAPALMSQPVRLYDQTKGGRQTFPLFILPRRVMEASLELLDTVERSVGGSDVKLTRYRYALPGVDVILWTDDRGKLYLADVPERHAAYVREGYEILRHGQEADPLLSSPRYDVAVERNLGVPMRDGIELALGQAFVPGGGWVDVGGSDCLGATGSERSGPQRKSGNL